MHLNSGGYPTSQPQPSPSFSIHIPPAMSAITSAVPTHQPYPGLNSIPGMHPTATSLAGMQTAMPSVNPIPGLHSFSSIPMPPFSNLIHATQDPHNQSLSNSHLSNHFGSSALLSGAIDKKRRQLRKPRTSPYGAIMGDDAQTMMMAAQSHAAQTLAAHSDPTGLSHSVPTYEADGIQFKILEQLPDTKINRLKTEKIKPIESLTFSDIKAYNRNQLRAYCSVYGIRRKKKAEMERDMARYAALFHPNDPAYDFSKFAPTEYADGPIPRRKIPVTKEQKELAAGDMKRLTSALQQRPQPTVVSQQHYGSSNTTHPGLSNSHGLHHHPTSVVSSASRLHDIHGMHSTAHTTQHLGTHGGHHDNEDHGVVAATDLMSVPEMQVPNHLLQITNQIGEE